MKENLLVLHLDGKSHVFLGEHHNNAIAHWLQFELTKVLHQQHGSDLMISMVGYLR